MAVNEKGDQRTLRIGPTQASPRLAELNKYHGKVERGAAIKVQRRGMKPFCH